MFGQVPYQVHPLPLGGRESGLMKVDQVLKGKMLPLGHKRGGI